MVQFATSIFKLYHPVSRQFFIPMTGYAAGARQAWKMQRRVEGVMIGIFQFKSVSLQLQSPFYPLREGLEIMPANTRIVKIEIFREPGTSMHNVDACPAHKSQLIGQWRFKEGLQDLIL